MGGVLAAYLVGPNHFRVRSSGSKLKHGDAAPIKAVSHIKAPKSQD